MYVYLMQAGAAPAGTWLTRDRDATFTRCKEGGVSDAFSAAMWGRSLHSARTVGDLFVSIREAPRSLQAQVEGRPSINRQLGITATIRGVSS